LNLFAILPNDPTSNAIALGSGIAVTDKTSNTLTAQTLDSCVMALTIAAGPMVNPGDTRGGAYTDMISSNPYEVGGNDAGCIASYPVTFLLAGRSSALKDLPTSFPVVKDARFDDVTVAITDKQGNANTWVSGEMVVQPAPFVSLFPAVTVADDNINTAVVPAGAMRIPSKTGEGYIVCSLGYRMVVDIQPGKDQDLHVCLTTGTGQTLWSTPRSAKYAAGPINTDPSQSQMSFRSPLSTFDTTPSIGGTYGVINADGASSKIAFITGPNLPNRVVHECLISRLGENVPNLWLTRPVWRDPSTYWT
jgi:hypothetical protein